MANDQSQTHVHEERYQFIAEEYYKYERENHRVAMQLQGDYGKWLVNALMIINGGAIVGLAQNALTQKAALPAAILWFVAGLVLALLCGFISWINWSVNARLHARLANPSMKFDIAAWPRMTCRERIKVLGTFYLAILAGGASTACIVIGAYVAKAALASS